MSGNSHGHCPTVKVKSDTAPGGYLVINESDRTADHVLHMPPPPLPPPPLAPPPLPSVLDSLPANWRDSKTAWLRETAAAVSGGRNPENREQAEQMIAAALKAAGK